MDINMLRYIWSVSVVAVLIVVSVESQASLVTYNGYTLDTSTHIVSKDGLEWLQWSETQGLVARNALRTYSPDGWGLATNENMAQLFSDFGWVGGADETASYSNPVNFQSVDYQSNASKFIALFGPTYQYWRYYKYQYITQAYFGSDANQNGQYNFVSIKEEFGIEYFPDFYITYEGHADIFAESPAYIDLRGSGMAGVALVRKLQSTVSEPSTFSIFLALTIGLLIRQRFHRY